MPLLDLLGADLQAAGLGTVGTDLFLGRLPETDVTPVVALLPYGGEPSLQTLQRAALQTVRLQACGRAVAWSDAFARVEAIYERWDGYRGSDIPGVFWIAALQPPFRIGEDEKFRSLVVCNLRLHTSHPAPVPVGGTDQPALQVADAMTQIG